MALNTQEFVEALIREGYTHLCVVPCSFAKSVINEVINNKYIEYVPAASEAVASSIAAGLKMSGKRPIVIIQSSGLTNMGSCITSLLKPYGVTFPILTSWRTYKSGDSEIQHEHLADHLPELIKSYGYGSMILDNTKVENSISQIKHCENSKIICLIKKDTFTKSVLNKQFQIDLSSYTPRSHFLLSLNKIFKDSDTLFIGTTGNTAREMYSFMPNTNNFYMAGNMGGALSLGLGAAMAGKKVIVCGGDAEFVMHLGGLTTAGRYKNDINLTYLLFDNETNKSTGGQNTYQQHLDYRQIAKASGLIAVDKIVKTVETFKQEVHRLPASLNFIHVKCGIDEETPRPPLSVIKKEYFR